MAKTRIIHAKIEKYLADYRHVAKAGYMPKYAAVLCDPPYFLDSIVRRFGKKSSKPAQFGTDGAFARAASGFMGETWDGFDSPQSFQAWVTIWAEMMLDFVHPGAVMMAFGSPRTYHRLVCGLEDAGWAIYDSIIAWTYGSGMPKSYNLHGVHDPAWDGFGTAISPSYEAIVIARAPRGIYSYDSCAKAFGSGALNIGGSRLASGRYPKNTILVHHPECTDQICHQNCHILSMKSQAGAVKSGSSVSGNEASTPSSGVILNNYEHVPFEGYADSGTAARFYYQAKAPAWEKNAGLETIPESTQGIGYNRDISPIKNFHPTPKPIQLTEYLAGLLKPPTPNARILIPFSGSGSEMIGAYLAGWQDITGIEMTESYIPLAQARLKWWQRFDSYAHAESHHKDKQQRVKVAEKQGLDVWEQMTLWEALS